MRPLRRAGSALIYATIITFVLAGIVALAVDWGRLQVTKSELRSAADAAARYGAAGLQNDIDGLSAAYGNAAASVRQNKANGRAIAFQAASDVQIGKWSVAHRTFTPTTDLNNANAVKVTLHCTAARGTAVPMTFMSIAGRQTSDVSAVSIAMIDYAGSVGGAGNGRYEYFVPATSNPWLSGMPAGTVASGSNAHNNPDYAGSATSDTGTSKVLKRGSGYTTGGSTDAGSAEANYAAWGDYAAKKASPIQAGGISINGGTPMTFDGINGGANNMATSATFGGDGNTANPVWNVPDDANRDKIYNQGMEEKGNENGISNVKTPINAIIGVYLSDAKPSNFTPPEALDFSTAASRDFNTLQPKLRQPFFIGDGRNANGEVQQFVPPAGATRLFIGTMDEYEWSNNVGGFYVTAHVKGRIITVQ
ncbi:MAG TPA: pilus assembly protein TadG-related protein [Tepidisphaeraceae bacterium]|jgi:Flp pilus assembly protein TadG